MLVRPMEVYKYKSVSTKQDFERLKDIILNNHIYMPSPLMLNDPMEANAVVMSLGIMGSGYISACGKIHSFIEEKQERYRVLSLSAIPNSTIMWAHYAKEYSGCCLIYSTERTLSDIVPVIYTDSTFEFSDGEFPDDDMPQAIQESLQFKRKDWSYENEWRVIQQKNAGYLDYEEDELLGIIVGENMKSKMANKIEKLCKRKDVACFRTYTMKSLYDIAFISYDLSKEFKSKEFEYITPYDMREHIMKKREAGQCARNEFELFFELNKTILRGLK